MRVLASLLIGLGVSVAIAADEPAAKVRFNYQMFCQGCHTPDGSGARHVPRMKDHVGVFTASARGREYLVRVPGSATSALNDDDLAAVLNWIVYEFSGASFNRGFEPYTAEEVGRLRQHPLNEVARHREELLAEIGSVNSGESVRP